jgi:hypothetical protein
MTKTAHSDRAHATLAPSAAHRWMVCPGSVVLEQGFPNTTSVYAAEGTAAHELAAWCLSNDEEPEEHLGLYVDIRAEHGNVLVDLGADDEQVMEDNRYFVIDDDMVAAVTVYTDFVRGLLKQSKDYEMHVEQRLDGTHLHPEIFGTGDFTGYSEELRLLDVVDYKHGKGHSVDVSENPQLMLYGALTVQRFHNRPVEKIRLHIVQPRAGGKQIKTAEYDLFDVYEFENAIVAAAGRVDEAEAALDEFNVKETPWQNAYLTAGEHCKFCRALATCPAARANALETAKAEFDVEGEMALPAISKMTSEELADLLLKADTILTWAKAVQKHAHEEACLGRMPVGFKLVAKRATRKWRDDDLAVKQLGQVLLRKDLFEEPKLKSPAKVEKLLKPKPFAAWVEKNTHDGVGPVVSQSSGTNLVPVSDPRPAVKADAASEFEAVE